MKYIKLTTAQALVRFLDNQYVSFDGHEEKFIEGVFTIFGHGNVLGIGQALEENPGDLKVHQGRNEQGMALAATAFAKQKNRKKIYACTTSVGPGAANMLTAAGTATANNIPVLLLPGDTFATRQPDPVLQQVEHTNNLSVTTNDAFKAVTKYWDRVTRPEQLMSAMINAMRVLTDIGDTGAVCVAMPQDVQGEVYEFPESFLAKRVHVIDRRTGTPTEFKNAVELVKRKKKPVIVCGGGVRYSEAGEELKKFASFADVLSNVCREWKVRERAFNPAEMVSLAVYTVKKKMENISLLPKSAVFELPALGTYSSIFEKPVAGVDEIVRDFNAKYPEGTNEMENEIVALSSSSDMQNMFLNSSSGAAADEIERKIKNFVMEGILSPDPQKSEFYTELSNNAAAIQRIKQQAVSRIWGKIGYR